MTMMGRSCSLVDSPPEIFEDSVAGFLFVRLFSKILHQTG